MERYIYCADIEDWNAKHPEVLERIPEGYQACWAGNDGVWCEPWDVERSTSEFLKQIEKGFKCLLTNNQSRWTEGPLESFHLQGNHTKHKHDIYFYYADNRWNNGVEHCSLTVNGTTQKWYLADEREEIPISSKEEILQEVFLTLCRL